jgi:hypothetical protein
MYYSFDSNVLHSCESMVSLIQMHCVVVFFLFWCVSGAAAALGPTGGMIAYGCSKAATHQLASSIVAGALKQKRKKCCCFLLFLH